MALHGDEVAVPIVRPAICPDPQFNRLQPVVGVATVRITAVTGAPDRSISIAVECGQENVGSSGCEVFGTTSPRVRPVR